MQTALVIVVTGSTGKVGRLVAEELSRRGVAQRLLVRDPARAPSLPGADVVQADYGDAGSLARALLPGDVVFMVSLHEGPERRVPLHRSFVDAAARAGVERVVYLSFVAAGPDAVFLHARSHGATEALLRESGLPFAAMRNGMYADEIPGWFDAEGAIRVDGGDGRMSFSYRPELAEAIAVVLTEPGHEGRVYDVVSADSVSMGELAAAARSASGDLYRYDPYGDSWWEERWRARGRSDWQVEAGLTSYRALRSGELDVVTGDFERLTGRRARSVREVVERLRDQLPLGRIERT
jgi:uncharacterized protein YbjT (DUF2867 family)